MPIEFKNVSHTYYPGTPFEYQALRGIDLVIKDQSFTAIVGHTGSGKSTLVQHINALLKPDSGEVRVNDYVINHKSKIKNIKSLRKLAGMVFQFPEYQLFEETIFKDIAFGPKNFGLEGKELEERVLKAIKLVGLDETYLEKSPFDISGGQKRRVAIASILAMQPELLILDEPTAGLDPQGAKEMMNLFAEIHRQGKTIIMISHEMDYVLEYCDEVVVLKKGLVAAQDKPINIFSKAELLKGLHITPPAIIDFANRLIANKLPIDIKKVFDIESLISEIVRVKGGNK